MQAPLVSIITPCFNHARFLGRAIDSALGQTHRPIEAVVVDDGSTDETPDVARSYGDRIRFFCTANQGLGAARNFGLERARGEFVVFLDDDNELLPGFVEETLKAYRQAGDPAVAYVYVQRIFFGAGVAEGAVSRFPPFNARELKRKNFVDACSLIRADVARRFGFDPAAFGNDDQDFFLTLAGAGLVGVLLDRPLYRYRVHGESITARVRGDYRQKAIARWLIAKHASLYSKEEAREALAVASNRIVCSVIENRGAGETLPRRLRGLAALIGERGPLAEIAQQALYAASPALYRRRREAGTGRGESA
jgi:glycosyltransferase involved in cell wall biosynthesis